MFTNVIVPDSPAKYEDYINRAIQLNQSVITSVEHGFQGNYWLLNELIENKNKELQERRDKGEKNIPKDLRFVFGTEAYWVKDRHEKDKSNCHMVLLAKNENARRKINLALSKANEDGMFNGRPRLDFELLFELPKDDVFITSACLAYWNKYEDIDEITVKLHNYFGDNFLLEVQNHNTKIQKEINKHILELSKKYNIKIIAGMDTHLIDGVKDNIKRDKILEYKGIHYEDEEGWYLDYPSYKIAFKRFKEQNVLTDEQISKALNNTNIIETFGGYNLNREIKLPTLYLDKTQEQKDSLFKCIINDEWKKFKEKEHVLDEDIPMYLEGIRYEVAEVIKTKMTDYFLLHYIGLKKGVENGGLITKRGRGSGVGFFINTLLGFSKVDRFKAPIKLYPERFLTSDRILKSKSLPDIDNNIDKQEPFVNAFKELLGEHGIYPMIAFGALKKSSAIKLYMGAEGIEASIQNEVSKQLQEYDKAIKHCETEEEKDAIDITKYISKEYVHYVEDSKTYQGIVIQKSGHPCAHILFNGDIREEIGLFRCESASTKKSVLTACIEGIMADHYKYLKTDLLIVDVVGITEAIWKRIDLPSPSNNELERLLNSKAGEKAWDMYAKGYTLCINQCEKEGTKKKCMKYKMRSTAELSAFVAAIRPAFGSLISNFLERKPYSTGVSKLDEVLKDSYHYMLYQESIMAYLNWLGINMKETYDIVKKISKKVYMKHPEQMEELKNKCKPQWINNVGNIEEFESTWKVMNDAGSYAFNSAHSYCVGNDGAEIAYTKAYYPYETYEVCLNWFDKKKNKDKVSALKAEMKEAFGIDEGELRFGLDNRKFTLDKKNKCIHPSLTSIKSMGKNLANELYELSQNNTYTDFYDLLSDMMPKTSINKTMLDMLIKLDYFKDFGKPQKLLNFVQYYNILDGKKAPKKATIAKKIEDKNIIDIINNNATPTEATYTKFDSIKCLQEIWSYIPNESIGFNETLINRKEILGYIDYRNNKLNKRYAFVSDINLKYTPVIYTYCLNNGITCRCKISKKIWNNEPLQENNIIFIHAMQRKFGHKKIGDKKDKKGNIKPIFEVDESKLEWWITEYSIIDNLDEVLENVQ
jgi:DNA polymerase III alpha subunit